MNNQDLLNKADSLLKEGFFIQAKAIYKKLIEKEPDNYQAILALGKISLFENNLAESGKWLSKAIAVNPEEDAPKLLLAEVYYRQDDFKKAAPLFRAANRVPMADKLQYVSWHIPYQIESIVDSTVVEFVRTDPLPVIKIRVNDSEEMLFIIDTGGAELILNTSIAEELDVKRFGETLGTFASGKQAKYYHGAIDSLVIGDFKIKNIPIGIMDLFDPRIKGIIGTVFLYHFIFTLDYPGGKLILQRKTEENIENLKAQFQSKNIIKVPFWMSGDHCMVTWGTVNGSKPVLFFVDTGLTGGGFTGTDSIIKEANIKLPERSFEGVGGGGKVSAKAAIVDQLALGDAIEEKVTGIFGVVPPSLEYGQGFRIAGMISHGFFRTYILTFDFASMNLFLEREKDEEDKSWKWCHPKLIC